MSVPTLRSRVKGASLPENSQTKAAILGCQGLELTPEEVTFFQEAQPLGLILFARNIESTAQVSKLIEQFKDAVTHPAPLILIDQEGGRVARLQPPNWRAYPPLQEVGKLYEKSPKDGLTAAYLHARLIAQELYELGFTVDCAPVCDLFFEDAHDVIGDRSYHSNPEIVATLAESASVGFMDGGILPVIKHIPGHGRAVMDSHEELPTIETSLEDLRETDFKPFKALADLPFAMTAHIKYSAIDDKCAATLSKKVIDEVIRGEIGFHGVLMTDALDMKALGGTFEEKTKAAVEAGCDLMLHCTGEMDEMIEVMAHAPDLSAELSEKIALYEDLRVSSYKPCQVDVALNLLNELLGGA